MPSRKSGAHQQAYGCFNQGQPVSRRKRSRGVIGRLRASVYRDRNSVDFAGDAASGALRAAISFYRKHNSFKRRGISPHECLHRMHGARGRSPARQRSEYRRIKRTARVQHDLSSPFFCANLRQSFRHFPDLIVGRCDDDHISVKNVPVDFVLCVSAANGAHRASGRGLRLCDHGSDCPVELPQSPAQCSSNAAGSNNRNPIAHVA